MNFSYFSNFASSGALCRKGDFLRIVKMPFVKRMIDEYRAGNKEAKKKLPAFNFHAHFPAGKRKSTDAIPSGCYMLDFDHCTEEEMKQIIDIAIPAEDQRATSPVLLVHITPSGKGIRIVAKATRTGSFASCRSISDYQHALAKLLRCEHKLDEVVTDLARLSFAPKFEDVLYLSDRLFREQAEVTKFENSAPVHHQAVAQPVAADPVLFAESTQTEYDGVPLDAIFREYVNLTGGMPQEGARNSRFYVAARDLRYICDFNPKTLAAHLPNVGLPAAEVFQLCVSACQSARSALSPAPPEVMRAISVARAMQEADTEEMNISGEAFVMRFVPAIASDFVKCCPPDFREAVLLSLLPIIGTLATRVRARYMDGEIHSPSFFTIVTSEQASGKSFARRLVRLLMASIAEEDARNREIELKFLEELKAKKNAKEQPEQPHVKIRLVPASISIAKLLQRLDYAEGDHLFTFAEEMDTLIKSNRSGAWSQKNDMYRNAFDNSEYGQDYMSESSYSTNLQVFYNLLVLGTPRQTERFFTDIENGLASRCCFATIADQFGAKMPKFHRLDANARLRIEHAVTLLRSASGEVDLQFVFPALEEWLEKQRLMALEENNRARDIFRRRAAVIGFRAVLAFSPLYLLNVHKNRQKLSAFAVEVAEIVLNNQLSFAGERLNAIISGGQSLRANSKPTAFIFQALPDVFTTSQVECEMRKRNMLSPARQLVYTWRRTGLIEKMAEKNTFRKVNPQTNGAPAKD